MGFFFETSTELLNVDKDFDKAEQDLIARNPVEYNKTMFRAFLLITKEECDTMGIQQYTDNLIKLRHVINTWKSFAVHNVMMPGNFAK